MHFSDVGKKAVGACRSGDGPIFIEFETYRFRGHVGPDDNIQGCHTDIRPADELEAWRKRDPIVRFEKYLLDNGVIEMVELEGIKDEVKREVEEAFEFARRSAFPDPGDLDKYVFAEQPEKYLEGE